MSWEKSIFGPTTEDDDKQLNWSYCEQKKEMKKDRIKISFYSNCIFSVCMHPKRTRHDTQKMPWSTWEWTCNEQSKSIGFCIFLSRKRVFSHSLTISLSLPISHKKTLLRIREIFTSGLFRNTSECRENISNLLFIQLTTLVSYIMKF